MNKITEEKLLALVGEESFTQSTLANEQGAGQNRKNTKVIAAFPGTGKTWCYMNRLERTKDLAILDSDSSKFPKEDFPANYIRHIKDNLGKVDVIFVSTHEAVRNALIEEEIEHLVIYPDIESKGDYMDRYNKRNSPEPFIKLMDSKWEEFIKSVEDINSKFCTKLVLGKNEYITDLLWSILEGSYPELENRHLSGGLNNRN